MDRQHPNWEQKGAGGTEGIWGMAAGRCWQPVVCEGGWM